MTIDSGREWGIGNAPRGIWSRHAPGLLYDTREESSMGLESNVTPLPDEDPAWGRVRFVCDYCGEAMLSRDGVVIVLPVEHGGEGLDNTFEVVTGDPIPRRYYVHRVDCEWHFIHEHEWTPDDYFSEDIRYKD